MTTSNPLVSSLLQWHWWPLWQASQTSILVHLLQTILTPRDLFQCIKLQRRVWHVPKPVLSHNLTLIVVQPARRNYHSLELFVPVPCSRCRTSPNLFLVPIDSTFTSIIITNVIRAGEPPIWIWSSTMFIEWRLWLILLNQRTFVLQSKTSYKLS